jgi:hypothetical protein
MFWRQASWSAVMPAQKSAHDTPPGIGVAEQFFTWHSQYFSQAGELALEPPLVPPLELPALELPALEPPALEPALPVVEPLAPAELGAPLAPLAPLDPPPESLEPQPRAVAHNEREALRNSDRIEMSVRSCVRVRPTSAHASADLVESAASRKR